MTPHADAVSEVTVAVGSRKDRCKVIVILARGRPGWGPSRGVMMGTRRAAGIAVGGLVMDASGHQHGTFSNEAGLRRVITDANSLT